MENKVKRITFPVLAALLCSLVFTSCSNTSKLSTPESSQPYQEQINNVSEQTSLLMENERLAEENSKLTKDNSSLTSENSSLKSEKSSLNSEITELKKTNSELSQLLQDEKDSKTEESSKTEETSKILEVSTQNDTSIKNIYIGNTIAGNGYELTLNNVSLTYKAVPDNPPSYYTYYEAKVGKVYIKVDATIKNTSKVSLKCSEIYSVIADYNNGYTYTGFAVADDYDGDFTYANITRVDPLETLGIHYLIDCPEEVDTNTNVPLSLTILLDDGSKYLYTIR